MIRTTALALGVLLGLAACGEAEWEEVPETAEIEQAETPGQLELDEETILGPDDIGERIIATGWVAGMPLPNGFFLRTEDDRVIFVATDQTVQPGQTVRVVGSLLATQAAVFEGWESDAFETGFEPDWDVETVAYIDASTVSPIDGPGTGGDAPQPDRTQEDAGTDMDRDTTEVDPGSKSG